MERESMIGQMVSLDATVFTQWILYGFVYSVLGWALASLIQTSQRRRPVNAGLLYGPWMLSSGLGALLGLLLSQWLPLSMGWHYIVFIVLLGGLYTLWDLASSIATRRFLLGGVQRRPRRSALRMIFSGIAYAVAASLMLYIVQPLLVHAVRALDVETTRYLSWLIQLAWAVDFIFTVGAINSLNQKREARDRERQIDPAYNPLRFLSELAPYERRLLRIYPRDGEEQWLSLLPEAKAQRREARRKDLRAKLLHFWRWLYEAPVIKEESDGKSLSFARGLNFYKLFWVFVIGSVIGFVIETVYCVIMLGHLESRQGMLYGPFSQIYGFGAILMLLPLYRLRRKNNLWVFCISAVVGGVFEAGASFFQESVFGSVSWEYSEQPLSLLGGRTSLLYMAMWGALGIFLIRTVYPKLSRWIERIPNRQGIVLTWVLFFFLLVDGALSSAAVYRWNQRLTGKEASTSVARILDEVYPDDYMERVYPNMQHTR